MVTRDVLKVLKISRAAAETFSSRIALGFWLITEANKTEQKKKQTNKQTNKKTERLEIFLAVVIIKFQCFP